MINPQFNRILVKFLSSEADAKELDRLDVELRKDRLHKTFREFVQIDYLSSFSMKEYDIDKAKKAIKHKIKKREYRRARSTYAKIAVAASILLFAGFFITNISNGTPEGIDKTTTEASTLKIGSDRAILTLGDGSQLALEKGKKFQTKKVVSNGEELIYSEGSANKGSTEALQHNYLTIPRGGQYLVQLSDGTKVWLNSDSKLKYPVTFIKGQKRIVELMYGEAYFEVSSSSQHDGATFNVLTNNQEIEVLGTKFNIKAYDGEDKITTTLVEGKVQVGVAKTTMILEPEQQSQVSVNDGSIEVSKVDVSQEISWINGLFIFEEEPLHEMMKVLSRWYDAEIFYEREELKDFQFTGVLKRTKSIEDLLRLVEASSDGQITFKIKEKVIIIK